MVHWDGVDPEMLERLFPYGGRWQECCEQADHNGLDFARTIYGRFNPYLAARWWLMHGAPYSSHWTFARCITVLSDHLRSRRPWLRNCLMGTYAVDETHRIE